MADLHLAYVGNIGVGKSELLNASTRPPLREKLLGLLDGNPYAHRDIRVFEEEFNQEHLDRYYANPKAEAFKFQMRMFDSRLARTDDIRRQGGICIEDRTLDEDYHIFGKAQLKNENMSDEEFEIYEGHFRHLTAQIPAPDLIVYFRADLDTLMVRIQKRGRESEKSISRAYLKDLQGLYEEWLDRYDKCPVITIDANRDMDTTDYLEDTISRIADEVPRFKHIRSLIPGFGEWVTMPTPDATRRAIKAQRKLTAYLHEHPCLITIAGNIGLGKTTLANILSEDLDVPTLYEAPEDNPLLEAFLADKKTHCYALQEHLFHMRADLRRKGKGGQSYIKDRSMAEDVLTFCPVFKRQGYLTESQFDHLAVKFRALSSGLPEADLIIHIQGSPELAWSQIQHRSRAMEVEGGWTYQDIQELHQEYQQFGRRVTNYGYHSGPILTVDRSQFDFINRIHLGWLMEEMHNALTIQEAKPAPAPNESPALEPQT